MSDKGIEIVYTKPQTKNQPIETLFIDLISPQGNGRCKLEYNKQLDEVEFECDIPKTWINRIKKFKVKKEVSISSRKQSKRGKGE